MNGESPAPGRASADSRSEVECDSSATGGHGVDILTAKQRGRWSPLTVDAILKRDPRTAQASDLAAAIGKVMRRDGTFLVLRNAEDALCVEIRPSHRDKVLELLGLSAWSWGEYVRRWEAAGLAHRCSDLRRGSVRLLLEPCAVCPVPMCGESLPRAREESGSEQRSTLPTATESMLTAGDASGDEEGDAFHASHRSKPLGPSSSEGSSEIAALEALNRVGATIGEPLSDEEIRALGYRSTSRGWVPIKGVTDAA